MKRLITGLMAVLTAGAASGAPVLTGPPPRALTDPASVTSPVSASAAPVPIAALFDVHGGMDAAWTPDGGAVVFSSNLSGRYNLWTIPAAGGEPKWLTQSDDRQSTIAITPDGRAIFESDHAGNEMYDLYAVPLSGGAAVNLTQTPEATETDTAVSPDGRTIAFAHRLKTEASSNIAVMDLASGKARLLTHEAAADSAWNLVGFTAGGATIIADRGDFGDTRSTVYAIDAASGRATALTPASNFVEATAVSRDGAHIAVTFEVGGARQAGLLDAATGKVTPLKPDAWEQSAGDFSPDGGVLIFSSNVDGRRTLFAYDVKRGTTRALPLPPGVNSEASYTRQGFSPDGSKLLVTHQSGNASAEFWVVDMAAWTSAPLTRFGSAALSPDRLPPSQLVHYKSADGTVISAFMWVPFNLKRDGGAPGIVYPHGGPTGQTIDRFDRTALALASRGYVVIAPNPRGSTGYGREFEQANRRDLGGGDLEDEVAAKRFMVATGYVDAKRVGITGGSYGGYMTLMAVAKTPKEWAAGVEEYGIIDWAHMYVTEAPTLQSYQRGLMGQPDTDAAVYKASSPMTYIDQERAPLLVLQGDNDIRVPRTQAEQVVAALKANGRTVDAHFYAGEGHGFAKQENQIDSLTRLVDWFDKYLKGGHGG